MNEWDISWVNLMLSKNLANHIHQTQQKNHNSVIDDNLLENIL